MATIIAEIVNAKSHADFKIPKLSLQLKKKIPINKSNAE